MMINKNVQRIAQSFISVVLPILSPLFFIACGSETGTETATPIKSEVDTSFELGTCTHELEGVSIRVTQENAYYVCINGNWTFAGNISVNSPTNIINKDEMPQSSYSPQIGSNSSVEQKTSNSKYVTGSLIDARDNQTYKTVSIGKQTWMAENLNFEYNIGSAKSWCYNDSIENCQKYGRIYTWPAAMDSAALFSDEGKDCGYYASQNTPCFAVKKVRGVCPSGWHLPDSTEYAELSFSIVGTYTITNFKGSYLCHQLKSRNGWYGYFNEIGEVISGNGSDAIEYSALPAGVK